MNIDEYLISGQLLFLTQEKFYTGEENSFEPEKIINIFRKTIERSTEEKWEAVRIIGEWGWILSTFEDINLWLEMEARFNYEFDDLPVILLCLWDQHKFNGDFLINLIKTHPFVTMGEDIYVNPFFKEPDIFLGTFKKKYYA